MKSYKQKNASLNSFFRGKGGAGEVVTFQFKWLPSHPVILAFTHTSFKQLLGIVSAGTHVAHLTVCIHTCPFGHHGNPVEWVLACMPVLEMKKQTLKVAKSSDHFITLRDT